MNRDTLEQDPCNTCGYEKGSIYCKEHCPHEAKIAQETSGDAVSRKIISAFLSGLISDETERKKALQYINELPPVNPTKTGHWIDDNENEIDAQYGRHLYKCSECNEYADMFVGGTEDWWDIEKPNYCPNCGAKMVEPQESEG